MASPNASDASCAVSSSPPSRPPAKPDPSHDPGVIPPIKSPPLEDDVPDGDIDIFALTPVAALKMLCRSIDALVRFTGDVPPTPPVRSRAPSPLRNGASTPRQDDEQTPQPGGASIPGSTSVCSSDAYANDIPLHAKTPVGSPEAHHSEPIHADPSIIGASAQPLHIQHGHLARKFYSKRPPPISTTDYLLRLHKYCPLSVGVYLATSVYITRIAVRERIIPVTPRNVHRLLLAGLRVAMKALEDLCWRHDRFSRVGGVTERELGRLELTFCFLMGFELRVDKAMLTREAEMLRDLRVGLGDVESPISMTFDTRMLELREGGLSGQGTAEKRKASTVLPSRPAIEVGVCDEEGVKG
jgi:Cyclin